MFEWFYKWKEQPPSIQLLIFTYGIYLLAIILTTVFVYVRLETVRIPEAPTEHHDIGRIH